VQRFSTLVTLVLFMFMLSWVAQAFQQDLPPFRPTPRNEALEFEQLQNEPEQLSERMTLPYRNGNDRPEPEAPPPQILPTKPASNKSRPMEPLPGSEPEIFISGSDPDSIHFLLLGRTWDCKTVDFLMIVTLHHGSHSILTAVDPALAYDFNGLTIPAASILQHGGTYDDLIRAATVITGLKPQFYIDLNIHGFMEMLELLGGIDQNVYRTLVHTESQIAINAGDLDGAELLSLLKDPEINVKDKEKLIIALLITARDIQHTTLGLKLLWTGYCNINTNLRLSDLLELRRVTQEISPTRVILREIRASG